MTQYVLDTNVISETARQKPAAAVLAWIGQLPSILLPSIAIYELAAGIRRLPGSRRRRFLEDWFADLLGSECEVLALDSGAALASADIEVEARHQRRVLEHRDLLILGTARARAIGVATRNVAHLRGLGVPVYDPFDDARFP